MTSDEFRAELSRLGLTIIAGSRILRVGERTARRWAAGGRIPEMVPAFLSKLTKAEAKRMLKELK